ncbi:hypothetical protein MLD38_035667 [Melastoma candidum]|uniref:Uncharacterized protein n=1 Tax=Melastoma candidum TaxID=119954 RepID=A0ACB9LI06_9MYRT|nr:hypothetical protein MLD38_035667 [Melastoma candidum]
MATLGKTLVRCPRRTPAFPLHCRRLPSPSAASCSPLPSTSSSFPSFSLPVSSRHPVVSKAVEAESAETSFAKNDGAERVRIVCLVGDGAVSPLKGASWSDVMLHTVERLKWVDEGYEMRVFSDSLFRCGDDVDSAESKEVRDELMCADILVNVAITDAGSVEWINRNVDGILNIISFDSSPDLISRLGGLLVGNESGRGRGGGFFGKILESFGSEESKESAEVVETVSEAWLRRNTDDIRFCLLVIINAYIRPVAILKNLRSKGFSTLNCMMTNCGTQVLDCLLDPNCRKALQCLNQCSPVDQVCNYRCIASYESPKLEAFSLCVLQKNNCLELDAKIPEKPQVRPMTEFREKKISHEIAEDLFVGWLGSLDWSWRVVAGQNPAYDQFPCQYQLFYHGKAKGSFWYEPVFQVKTLEGNIVWRRRKYRVKRGKIPGTFNFSVLDNGVVSNEFWTIVDVSDDLGWGLFHYSGAARVAGQSYTGAVLVSPNGEYPGEADQDRLKAALDKCKIKEWELFDVSNGSCRDPPLGIPDGSSLHKSVVASRHLPKSEEATEVREVQI